MSVSAACVMIFWPVAVEPVNIDHVDLVDERGARVAAARWRPRRRPSGMPHSRRPSASSRLVSGVTSLGLRITALPATSAGMQSPNEFVSG